ncbi:MAG: pseudouridine synthase [Desertifilum sp.]|nr:pseudouridine synthase [Desertifilum sp.]
MSRLGTELKLMLQPLSDFLTHPLVSSESSVRYEYQGKCPQTGEQLKLPRTAEVEAIALGLMRQLAQDPAYATEGKMYGVLLVELPNGEKQVLRAFSGLLFSQSMVAGWVPPIPGRDRLRFAETQTLAKLNAIKDELLHLQQLPERQEYQNHLQEFEQRFHQLRDRISQHKRQRQAKRQILHQTLTGEALLTALEALNQESRLEGIEQRHLKRDRDRILQPLQAKIQASDRRISELKQQRKTLSRRLQNQMHAAYSLTNFLGQSLSLNQLSPALPTGTGDCCAPKLLHYAATHQLKPLAMAEFWWGPSKADKIQGEFYGACVERCQPIMGFLLAGLSSQADRLEIPIVYEDEWLIVVDKPTGILSVPGREFTPNVLSHLRQRLPDGENLIAVHRLDRDTSGLLMLARHFSAYRQLSQQFQQRQVQKRYEALLSGCLEAERGVISLPLWGDPQNRPYQTVDEKRGKPSVTEFQAIATQDNCTRIELKPITGRSHQLRVHCADPRGLGIPILGDRLYGCSEGASRLHLHAKALTFEHPDLAKRIELRSPVPF